MLALISVCDTHEHILRDTHTHTPTHTCRHSAAPAFGWPINHVEREESRGQWSVSYSNNQSYISQIAYPTEQAANQTGRQRGGNHCLTPEARRIKVCVGSRLIIRVHTSKEISILYLRFALSTDGSVL